MRTSFELKIAAADITEAKQEATKSVAKFLNLPEKNLLDHVNMELKVSYPEAKTLVEIGENMDNETYIVTVFGSVKQNVVKPFGL